MNKFKEGFYFEKYETAEEAKEELLKLHPIGSDVDELVKILEVAGANVKKINSNYLVLNKRKINKESLIWYIYIDKKPNNFFSKYWDIFVEKHNNEISDVIISYQTGE